MPPGPNLMKPYDMVTRFGKPMFASRCCHGAREGWLAYVLHPLGIHHTRQSSTLPWKSQSRWAAAESNTRLLWSSRNACSCPSYWHTIGSEPLLGLTVGKLLQQAAECYGEREAVVVAHENVRLSFRQVLENVNHLAAGLLAVGLQPGDRLALWGPNSSQWYISSLAAMQAGLIVATINPAYKKHELQYCLAKVGVKALITTEKEVTRDCHNIVSSIIPELVSCQPGHLCSDELPELSSLIMCSEERLPGAFTVKDVSGSSTRELLKRLYMIQNEIQPDAPCNIQFTSGTTGKPKAAVLSHHNIVNNSYLVGKRLGFDKQAHRICLQVPLFHCYGFCNGLLASLHHGATVVMPSSKFNALQTLKVMQSERCSVVYGTPTMYVDLISALENYDCTFPELKMALSSGSACSKQLFLQIMEKLGLDRVCSVYGLTETSPVVFQSHLTDSSEQMLTTVGQVSEHVEAKVVDRDGKIVPLGVSGELWVRGYCSMLGYWDDAAKTQELYGLGNWLKTGDLFVLKENGYGKIIGRLKDVIIRGGENVFPKEVEEFLESHPDIKEAQVFGVPDMRLGEIVCACVRMDKNSSITQDELTQYCKGKIASFKIPHIIHIMDEFPKTVSGKIQKFKLQELIKEKYNRT